MKKKHDKTAFSSAGNQHKRYPGQWMSSHTPVPVPTNDAYKHDYRPFSSPSSPAWQRFIDWLYFHYIQTRWDIERLLARKLHRRWGDRP